MTKYTVAEFEEITQSYWFLIQNTNNGLKTHVDELESFDYETKINLVTKLVLECPEKKWSILKKSIRQLSPGSLEANSFFGLLDKGIITRERLYPITAEDNKQGYINFIAPMFEAEFYKTPSELAVNISDYFAVDLATNLAIHTPLQSKIELQHNIRNCFAASRFVTAMNEAFRLDKLLSDLTSERFLDALTNKDFNQRLLQRYASLVCARLINKEEIIAEELFKDTESKELIKASLHCVIRCHGPVSEIFALILGRFCELHGMTSRLASPRGLPEKFNESFNSSDKFSDSESDNSSEVPEECETYDEVSLENKQNPGFKLAEAYSHHGFMNSTREEPVTINKISSTCSLL